MLTSVLLLGACTGTAELASDSGEKVSRKEADTGSYGPVQSGTQRQISTGVDGSNSQRSDLLDLQLCPLRRGARDNGVSNAPVHVGNVVSRQSPTGCLEGRSLLLNPAPNACLTSGSGLRSGRPHQGLDFQSRPAGPVVAAAAGTLVELGYRKKDYGNWMVIDHGQGVYSGYAHLQSSAPGLRVGSHVSAGQELGIMGRTGGAATAIHLHYEIRTGDLDAARSWFRLAPVDPFSLPAVCA